MIIRFIKVRIPGETIYNSTKYITPKIKAMNKEYKLQLRYEFDGSILIRSWLKYLEIINDIDIANRYLNQFIQ